MLEHIVLVAGPMGAGKTTAIGVLGDAERVVRDAGEPRHVDVDVDYGEILLSADELVRLYGVPGGKRFDFMWAALRQRATGVIVLVRNDSSDPIGDLDALLEEFHDAVDRESVVVGVTHRDVAPEPSMGDYRRIIDERHPGVGIPVLAVDARDPDQLRAVLSALVANRR